MMRVNGWNVGVVALALALVACEGAEVADTDTVAEADTVDHEAAIEELRSSYVAAFNAGEPDGVIVHYTDDFVEYTPEGTLDRATVEAGLRDTIQGIPPGATLQIHTEELEVAEAGDYAYGVGTSDFAATGPDGEAMQGSDRWMAVFKNDHGTWKLYRLALMPDGSAAAAAGATAPAETAEPADAEEETADTM